MAAVFAVAYCLDPLLPLRVEGNSVIRQSKCKIVNIFKQAIGLFKRKKRYLISCTLLTLAELSSGHYLDFSGKYSVMLQLLRE